MICFMQNSIPSLCTEMEENFYMKIKRGVHLDAMMTEGVIWKQLMLFILPIIFGSFFQQLYNTTDAVIVGNFVGKEALAAVGGSTAHIINLLVGFFIGLASGGSVIIAQYYGAKAEDRLQTAIHTTIALGIAGGCILMAIGIIFAPYMLQKMDTPADVIDYAVTYMRIYFIGVIPNLLYNLGAGILRALGDSKRPLYLLICGCFVNIILDILFVAVLRMEAAGAAWATILSQLFSCVGVLWFLIRHPSQSCRLYLRRIRFNGMMLALILKIGFPAGIQSSLYSISNILIQSTINSFGTDTMAAWTVYGKIESVYWMIISAFGVAMCTFSGQNFGAQKYDRIKKGVKVCWLMSVAATAVIVVFCLTCGEYVCGWFNDDAAVLALCKQYLHIIPLLLVTYNTIEIICAAVRGAGDAIIPMIITLLGVCALRIVWIYTVVPVYHSMITVALSYPVTWIITSLIFLFYYLHGGWLRRCQKKQP